MSSSSSAGRKPHGPLADLAAPLAVALALRLLFLLVAPTVPTWDGVIYVRAAEQLARGEGYTLRILNEASAPHPTAFYPVGFPALLALVRLLGGGLESDRVLQALASAALVPISYFLARRARHRRAGRLAAWLAALYPGGIVLSATWLAEPVFALVLGASVLPLLYAPRRRRPWALALCALVLGLLAYVRASSLPMAALLGLALGWHWKPSQPRSRRVLGAALVSCLMTALACVPLAPWAYRNQQKLGAPILVSTNGGVNLLLGTRGDGGFVTVAPDEPCKREPLREVERDRCYSRRAVQAIVDDPIAWLGRGLVKLAHTFGHESAPAQCFAEGLTLEPAARMRFRLWALGLCRLGWLLLLAGAIAGAVQVWRRASTTSAAVLLAPILALAALHAVYLGGDRYHPAVAPMMLALAAIALGSRAPRRGRAPHAPDTSLPKRPDLL